MPGCAPLALLGAASASGDARSLPRRGTARRPTVPAALRSAKSPPRRRLCGARCDLPTEPRPRARGRVCRISSSPSNLVRSASYVVLRRTRRVARSVLAPGVEGSSFCGDRLPGRVPTAPARVVVRRAADEDRRLARTPCDHPAATRLSRAYAPRSAEHARVPARKTPAPAARARGHERTRTARPRRGTPLRLARGA